MTSGPPVSRTHSGGAGPPRPDPGDALGISAEGGPGKRIGSNPDTAPRSDPYVIGAAGKTAVATLVERSSRFLMLIPLTGRDSLSVGDALCAAVGDLPATLRQSLTWDCGSEMARHQQVTAKAMPVFFAHPHSPWQRGSNENANRILREYLPKGTTITNDRDYLAAVAAEINDRP